MIRKIEPATPQAETQAEERFETKFQKIKDVVEKDHEQAHEKIWNIFDSNFKNEFDQKIKDETINKKTQEIIKKMEGSDFQNKIKEISEKKVWDQERSKDKKSLDNLMTFLWQYKQSDLVTENLTGITSTWWKTEKYNQNNNFILNIKNEINKDLYKDMPWLTNIKTALENPTKENIQKLQIFLLDNFPSNSSIKPWDFLKSSFKIKQDWSFDKKQPDGKFWEKTNLLITSLLKEYEQLQTSNLTAQTNTENIAKTTEETRQQQLAQEQEVDITSQEQLAESRLAGILSSEELQELNNTKIKVDWDNIIYRGEKISFSTLDISRKEFISNNFTSGWMSNNEEENNIQEYNLNDDLIINYLTNDKSGNENRTKSRKLLNDMKNKIDEKINNSVIYNDKTNNYQYKWYEVNRDGIKTSEDLQNFQNEVDKMTMKNNNNESVTTTQTSPDWKIIRTIEDKSGNNYKITKIDNSINGFTTTSIDKQRWDKKTVKEKTVETSYIDGVAYQKTVDKNIYKEDKDSFKDKQTNNSLNFATEWADLSNLPNFTKEDFVNIFNSAQNSGKFFSYDVDKSILGNSVSLKLKNWLWWATRESFLNSFKEILKNAGVQNINMDNYKFKWRKNEKNQEEVTSLSFDIGEWSKINKEIVKFNQAPDFQRGEIPAWVKGFKYAKIDNQLFARYDSTDGNTHFQRLNMTTNKWEIIDKNPLPVTVNITERNLENWWKEKNIKTSFESLEKDQKWMSFEIKWTFDNEWNLTKALVKVVSDKDSITAIKDKINWWKLIEENSNSITVEAPIDDPEVKNIFTASKEQLFGMWLALNQMMNEWVSSLIENPPIFKWAEFTINNETYRFTDTEWIIRLKDPSKWFSLNNINWTWTVEVIDSNWLKKIVQINNWEIENNNQQQVAVANSDELGEKTDSEQKETATWFKENLNKITEDQRNKLAELNTLISETNSIFQFEISTENIWEKWLLRMGDLIVEKDDRIKEIKNNDDWKTIVFQKEDSEEIEMEVTIKNDWKIIINNLSPDIKHDYEIENNQMTEKISQKYEMPNESNINRKLTKISSNELFEGDKGSEWEDIYNFICDNRDSLSDNNKKMFQWKASEEYIKFWYNWENLTANSQNKTFETTIKNNRFELSFWKTTT